MAGITAVDLRFSHPVCCRLKSDVNTTVGFSDECDLKLPEYLAITPAFLEGPLISLEWDGTGESKVIMRGPSGALDYLIGVRTEKRGFSPHCAMNDIFPVDHERETRIGGCVELFLRRDRIKDFWNHTCVLLLENCPPSSEEDSDETDLPYFSSNQWSYYFDRLPHGVLEGLFQSLSIFDVCVSLPCASFDAYCAVKGVVCEGQRTVWDEVTFTPYDADAARLFFTLLRSPGNLAGIGTRLKVLEAFELDLGMREIYLYVEIPDLADFMDVLPNLEVLKLGKGTVRFLSSSRPFQSRLRELVLWWDCVGFMSAFPFGNMSRLETLVVVTPNWRYINEVYPEADLPNLKTFTLVERDHRALDELHFILEKVSPRLEVLRIPKALSCVDETLDFIGQRFKNLKHLEIPGSHFTYNAILQLITSSKSLEIVTVTSPDWHLDDAEGSKITSRNPGTDEGLASDGPLKQKISYWDENGSLAVQMIAKRCPLDFGPETVPVAIDGEWRYVFPQCRSPDCIIHPDLWKFSGRHKIGH